jgi:hypothetical protein
MSDTESFGSFESLSSVASVEDELEILLLQLHEIHEQHNLLIESLESLHQRVLSEKNMSIQVSFENTIRDFDDVLDELHSIALAEIEENEKTNFGANLLALQT